jgi:DNA gyrase subunit A
MEIGIVRQVDIDQQMQSAYLDYAMSVIVSRALPDVRDGLKPVHRRILYAMHDMGVRAGLPYKKSARIVGEVLGKYHPHGDAAVYDSMVRMAQDFSMRVELIDGQGNFGSVDGDPPAAMRYTEARLARAASEMLTDIDRDTVDFVDNFDGSLTEPSVLPARLPNLLINGASGIAVGMATSIPPHNLGEVCDALIFMIERTIKNEEVSLEELLNFIQGPDFPTGGIVYRYTNNPKQEDQTDLIRSAYAVGRGRITVQAKVHIEEMSRNRHRLVITELPYQTNKANLAEKIADLTRDGKLEGLADLRDESDRQGMRLVIELTRTVAPREVLKQLFKLTAMKSTFSINMLALVEGEPRTLPLKRALQLFIKHRLNIITRRSKYELNQARQRAHILEGLRLALANLDEVIQTIRASRNADSARNNLRKNFRLSEAQATAILDMPLRRLAALEQKKIETEYKELLKQISYLEGLLKSRRKILDVIKQELIELKATYATPRLTLIADQAADAGTVTTAHDLIPDEALVVSVTDSGQLCSWPADRGLDPARGRQKDPLSTAVTANSRDSLYLFTTTGQALILPMHQVPRGETLGDGTPVSEIFTDKTAQIVTAIALPHSIEQQEKPAYLFFVSSLGRVKRIALADLADVRGSDATVIGIEPGDKLLTTFVTQGDEDVILISSLGQGIRFSEEDVRAMGLTAAGVWGMKLSKGDHIVGAGPVSPRGELVIVTSTGYGKRVDVEQFSPQGRYGQGVIAFPLGSDVGLVTGATVANLGDRIMMISMRKNSKTVYVRSLPKAARTSKGKAVMSIKGNDALVSLITLQD